MPNGMKLTEFDESIGSFSARAGLLSDERVRATDHSRSQFRIPVIENIVSLEVRKALVARNTILPSRLFKFQSSNRQIHRMNRMNQMLFIVASFRVVEFLLALNKRHPLLKSDDLIKICSSRMSSGSILVNFILQVLYLPENMYTLGNLQVGAINLFNSWLQFN